jgi:hypothetical protein
VLFQTLVIAMQLATIVIPLPGAKHMMALEHVFVRTIHAI